MDQQVNPSITPSNNPSPEPTSPVRRNIFFAIIGVFVLLVVAGFSYYLGTLRAPSTLPNNLPIPSPTILDTIDSLQTTSRPTVSTVPPITLPAGWVYRSSQKCNVQIPIPPKQDPYLEKQNDVTWFWQFQEGGDSQGNSIPFEDAASALFYNDKNLGGGYLAGLVSVWCSRNAQNYTTQSYARSVMENIRGIEMFMGDPITCTPTQTSFPLWNTSVEKIESHCMSKNNSSQEIDNPIYYVFATPGYTYVVRNLSDGTKLFLKETTDTIFEHLKFL